MWRGLTTAEVELARTVFRNRLPYERIRITDTFLPGNKCPVTLATVPFRFFACYFIFWDETIFEQGADRCHAGYQATFIHELTHVWQGHHALSSQSYMLRASLAQTFHAVRDVIRTGSWRGWHHHRSAAYGYSHKPCQPWRRYNAEQQASLVGDWFDARDGDCSTSDWRHFYIEHVIRAGRPRAAGRPQIEARG